MPKLFVDRSLEPMPDPPPENYLVYAVDFDNLYRDYCRWARRVNRRIVSKVNFADCIISTFPRVGWHYRGNRTEIINVKKKD